MTSSTSYRRLIDVETTLCVYWVQANKSFPKITYYLSNSILYRETYSRVLNKHPSRVTSSIFSPFRNKYLSFNFLLPYSLLIRYVEIPTPTLSLPHSSYPTIYLTLKNN